MSSPTIAIPQGFSFVGAAVLSTTWVLLWQFIVVNGYRNAAGIKYPQMYAEKAEVEASKAALKFNCAQRTHQNTLENLPIIVIMTLISGLKYPILAASACALWSLTRIPYTLGYITGDPKRRLSTGGGFGYFAIITLVLASSWTIGEFVLAEI